MNYKISLITSHYYDYATTIVIIDALSGSQIIIIYKITTITNISCDICAVSTYLLKDFITLF